MTGPPARLRHAAGRVVHAVPHAVMVGMIGSTSMFRPAGSVRPMSIGMIAVALATVAPACASAQTKLVSRYTISVAGLAIGHGDLVADIAADRYAAMGSGRAAGFLRILVSGEGRVTARGRMVDGRPDPSGFAAVLDDENERTTVRMGLDAGTVTELSAESTATADDRVPLTDDYLRNVVDPLSAMLVPAAGADPLSADVCRRSLPIFDGRRRYDLNLSFKRIDRARDTQGYAGPVVVCAVALRPIAGHKRDSALVKYLADGRELELWLAPIAGTGVLGPYRLSVANMIGDLVIAATRYEAEVTAPLRPSISRDGPAK